MFSAAFLVVLIAGLPPPAEGLDLASPDPIGPTPDTAAPTPTAPVVPIVPLGFASSLAGLAAVATLRAGRRRGGWERSGGPEASWSPGDAISLKPPEDTIVVFVSGHGSGESGTFDDLIELMGLDPQQAAFFDYRWVLQSESHRKASQFASTSDSADVLSGYLAGLAWSGRPMYMVGHSKGGAVIAELLARWDSSPVGRVKEVEGAALLDAPLSGGVLGALQSVGAWIGPVPDDGGYNPVHCELIVFSCEDTRDHLGRDAGVEVVVFRNPNAVVTNFWDQPEGLRVYDVADDGPSSLDVLMHRPLGFLARVTEAHGSVLTDPRPARCIVEEMSRPGSCSLGRSGGPAKSLSGGTPSSLGNRVM